MKVGVVGLGIAGLSICTRLSQAGHEVFGFEQFDLMHERGSSHGDTRIFRLTPGEGAIYVPMAERAQTLWRAWEAHAGKRLLSTMPGVMAGGPASAFVAACRQLAQDHRHPAVFLAGGDVETATEGAIRLPSDWSVCLQRDCGVLFADGARAFLIEYARSLGAQLFSNTPVRAPIESATLFIAGAQQRFDAVIIAAGGWTRTLAPATAPLLTPKRRVMAWLRPFAPLTTLAPILCIDNEAGLYGMPTPEGHYKIGLHTIGEAVDPDQVEEPNAQDLALLSAQARAYLPLHDPTPVALKRCLYTMTGDENFFVAPLNSSGDERVLAFSCCSGHGFKYAPIYGDIALDWLEQRPSKELTAFGGEHRIIQATKLGGANRDHL